MSYSKGVQSSNGCNLLRLISTAEESGFIQRGPIAFLFASSSSERIWGHPAFYPLLIRTLGAQTAT